MSEQEVIMGRQATVSDRFIGERTPATDEMSAKVDAFAKEMGWDMYCINGIKKNEKGELAFSTYCRADIPHAALMIEVLCEELNRSAMQEAMLSQPPVAES